MQQCEEYIELEEARWSYCGIKQTLMTVIRDELLKVCEIELLNKDSGIDSMLARTGGRTLDAQQAREGEYSVSKLQSDCYTFVMYMFGFLRFIKIVSSFF